MGWQIVVMGSVLGIVGALPSAYLLERALRKDCSISVAMGLASIMISFVMLSCIIFVVWLAAHEHVLTFGVSLVASFLFVWAVEAVRAWRDAQRGASERKEEW